MEQEEIRIIASKVAKIIKEEATSVDDLPKTDTLAGVYSLPGIQNGRVVEVMLSLLKGVDGKSSRIYTSEEGIMGQMGDDAPIVLISFETIENYAKTAVTESASEAAKKALKMVEDAVKQLKSLDQNVAETIEQAATKAATQAEEQIAEAEEQRVAAEQKRISSENTRAESETNRVSAEKEREKLKEDMITAKEAANTAADRANTAAETAEGAAAGVISKEAVENVLTDEIDSHTHPTATQEKAGFLSAADKKKLDELKQGVTEVAWNDISEKPETFTPAQHEHTASEITDFQAKVNEYAPAPDLSAYETAAQALAKYALKQHAHTVEEITDLLQSLANNLAAANEYTDTKISEIIGTAPDTLDTIQELSDAIGDDPNFTVTIANMVAEKLDKSVFELFKQSATSKITNLESHFTNDKRTITEDEAAQISKIANIEAQLSGLDSALDNLNSL